MPLQLAGPEQRNRLSDAETEAAALIEPAHERVVRASVGEMASFLQDLVGQQLTAGVAGIGDPQAVGRWARGEYPDARPSGDCEKPSKSPPC